MYQSPIKDQAKNILFDQYDDEMSDLIEHIDTTCLPLLGGKKLMDTRKNLLNTFDDDKYTVEKLISDPPQLIADFFATMRRVIPVDMFYSLFDNTRPGIPDDKAEVKSFFLFLVIMLHESNNPLKVLQWCMRKISTISWQRTSSASIDDIKALAICTVKKSKYWAILDKENNFTYYLIDPEKGLVKKASGKASSIEAKRGVLTIEDKEGKVIAELTPENNSQLDQWEKTMSKKAIPFPLMLTSIERPLPPPILPILYRALIADDMLIARALTQSGVVKITKGTEMCDALLDIFSYARRVDPLLQMMVSNEFDNRELTEQKICRENSHLTNMFKVFHAKYSQSYVDKFINKVIKLVSSKSDIGLDNLETCKKDQAEVLFFTVMKYFLGSGNMITPQIRHFASVLKNASNTRFNTQQAAYNSIMSFFCLRFFTPNLTVPTSQVCQQFAKLIQNPFNLVTFEDDGTKPHPFKSWNKRIEQHIFPKLIPFILSLSEYDDSKLVYDVPTKEDVNKSLNFVLDQISTNYKQFSTQYMAFMDGKNTTPVIGWDIGSFLLGFFKENPSYQQ